MNYDVSKEHNKDENECLQKIMPYWLLCTELIAWEGQNL